MLTSDNHSGQKTTAFDAYYELLGIPPAEQPPTYYRLLGLSPLESNATVIERAADRQMSHLRTFKSGQAALASQPLLSEIAKASRILLSPTEKAAYDRTLQLPAAAAQPSAVRAPATHLPPAPAGPAFSLPVQAQTIPIGRAVPQFIVPSTLTSTDLGQQQSSDTAGEETPEPFTGLLPIVAAGAIGCVMVVLLIVIVNSTRSSDPSIAEAKTNDSQSTPGVITSPPPSPLMPAEVAEPSPIPATVVAPVPTPAASPSPPSEVVQPMPVPKAAPSETSAKTEEAAIASESADGWVDLFKEIRPKDDALAGDWTFNGKELSAAGNGMAKFRLPADLRNTSYDLRIEFISDRDPENVNVILPVGDRSVLLVGDGYLNVGTYSYFAHIQGKEPIHFPGSVRGSMLAANVRYKYDISVRLLGEQAKLNLDLNDKPAFEYTGPIKDLKNIPVYRLPDDGWPGLASWFSPITFLSCKIRLHEGPGKVLRRGE